MPGPAEAEREYRHGAAGRLYGQLHHVGELPGTTTDHRALVSDNCADKYAEWTVSNGSAGPGSAVWADIEHTPATTRVRGGRWWRLPT
ncbi:hypothetical protein OG887_05425 [Streptomyces sp. NBC_00053]|uniref:hypothetical protein n=1 Tax=unclassified Streptomyces TaxID=2593676 RepID=UPI00224FCB1E|nr:MULTISPECIES: hypothetical protein [unclassified Streptomyces]WSG49258.1 hypothetical protein OHA38_05335 [Streptomyces sp. NBC_01732]MCX5158520.1 hypothetical protein [Streptomyces sp. NBC_00305]MCX5217043.1 hypothetical protein [Streptomyces sp. NBC_00264]MCX5498839.1 hypothetical protein [Streptomyces sp. NBC_00052]MCX5552629.1 hypothetical protein [Streptomyces sp. NBC_00051]